MFKATLFKGATRPAEMLGVPLNALILINLPLVLLGFNVSKWFFVASVILLPILRHLAKQDDNIFRLLGMKILTVTMMRFRKDSKGNLLLINTEPRQSVKNIKYE